MPCEKLTVLEGVEVLRREHGNELAVATEVSHLLMNAPPLTQSLTLTPTALTQSCVRSPTVRYVLTTPSLMAAPS